MNTEHFFGKIGAWYDDRGIGKVIPEHDVEQPIVLHAADLSEEYTLPQVGDEIGYSVRRDDLGRTCAANITFVRPLHEDEIIDVVLKDWDFGINGGLGLYRDEKPVPVFVLGAFLKDKSRAPYEGETVRGRLKNHDNGQWMLIDIEIVTVESGADKKADWSYQPTPKSAEFVVMQQVHSLSNGVITQWNPLQGVGFIGLANNAGEVFFQLIDCVDQTVLPQIGQHVNFYCITDKTGRKRAYQVMRLNQKTTKLLEYAPATETKEPHLVTKRKYLPIALIIAVAFLTFLLWFCQPLAIWDALLSAVSLVMYRHDKQIALNSNGQEGFIGRVPEMRLHWLDFLGGWPGGLVARHLFHHKTSKPSFIRLFWLSVLLNVMLSGWLVCTGWMSRLVA